MKLAYLANIRFPSERAHSAQIAHMCQAFAENDVEADLVVNTRRAEKKEEVDDFFNIDSRFKINRLPYGFFNYRFKIIFYASELIFTFSFLLHGLHKKYDVIFSRSEFILWTLSFIVDKNKIVWESHEARISFFARQILKKGIKTVVISEGIFEDYVKHGISSNQLLIAHDGIDESFFGSVESREQARARLGLPFDERIIMYIGGFDEWKGVDIFCQASKFCQGIKFVAIGGREDQINDKRGKYTAVEFLGALPYRELKDNQQAADILVIPNTAKTDLSSRHTSPLKLFAHAASGIPLVISNVPSLTSVTGEDLVTVFNPDDPHSLAKKLTEIIEVLDKKKLAAIELKKTTRRYTWRNRAASILSYIGYNH